ncbi:MAG: carbon monoxide dehydrogenase [Paucimonas sp.]|jgi:carbon-monoxide dehydrogenase small subunit|nr:carbon monoxide dehydrogenase [Paucimonas sp.]
MMESGANEVTVEMVVNGTRHSRRVESRMFLAQFLREELGLTGTHVGCDTCQCGCCTVHVNGDAVKSCTMLAVQAEQAEVRTIEGLAGPDGSLHPLQEAFSRCHGLQCGYCTPGFVMSAAELIEKYGRLDPDEIRDLLDGNMCRCTGYHNIVMAIHSVMHGEPAGKMEEAD